MKQIKLKEQRINKFCGDRAVPKYLADLGLTEEQVNRLMYGPQPSDKEDPLSLVNMDVAGVCAHEILSKPDAVIYVQPDADCDGYTSSAILIGYLRQRYPHIKIMYQHHEGKGHGIIPELIPDGCQLAFYPDGGTNDKAAQTILAERGIKCIVLDHHIFKENEQHTDTIIVNNQNPLNPNANHHLSGAGVTLLFIEYLDQTYFADLPSITDDFYDLAAVGMIADVMNLSSVGVNYIVARGLSNIQNRFLLELAVKQSRGIASPTNIKRSEVAFYIAPVINGLVRSGTMEEKEQIFAAMCGIVKDIPVYTIKDRELDPYENCARIAINAKSRQDNGKKKAVALIEEYIEANNWQHNNLLLVPLTADLASKVPTTITGLVAMELVKKYNRPTLLLRPTAADEDVFGGSGRNGKFVDLPSLFDFLKETETTKMLAGHGNAFGVSFQKENLSTIVNIANDRFEASMFDQDIVEVDCWFEHFDRINSQLLFEFADYGHLWGVGIPKPQFAFSVQVGSVPYKTMGKNANTVKFTKDNIDFIKFNGDALIDVFNEGDFDKEIIIYGTPTINEWGGRQTIQVMVDDFEVRPLKTLYSAARSLLD